MLFIRRALVACTLGAVFTGCSDAAEMDAMDRIATRIADGLHLVEDLRIDGVKEEFSIPSGFLLVQRGNGVVFADQLGFKLRAYDWSGRHRFDFGRRGQGPGEFAAVGRLSVLTGGTVGDNVWVFDRPARRITLLDQNGRLVATVAAPGIQEVWVPDVERSVGAWFEPLAVYPDGRMLTRRRAILSRATRETVSDLVMLGANDDSANTLFSFGSTRTETLVDPETGQSYSYTVGGGVPRMDVSQDGSRIALVWQRTDTIPVIATLLVLSPAGDTVVARSLAIGVEAELPPGAENTFADQVERDLRGANVNRLVYSEAFIRRVGRTLRERASRVRAPILAILVGIDDTIWLVMKQADERVQYRILDSAGDSIGTVVAPVPSPRTYTAAVSRDYLWALVSDQDGVPSIIRYRVVGWPER